MRKKQCRTCNRKKERHLYLAAQWNLKVKQPQCKSCWRKDTGYGKDRDRYYRKTYGITLAEYDAMLEDQAGRCFICMKAPGKVRLAVDHDHAIEKKKGTRASVRGLLCRPCNEFLGHIGDDHLSASLMRTYLTRGTQKERGVLQ